MATLCLRRLVTSNLSNSLRKSDIFWTAVPLVNCRTSSPHYFISSRQCTNLTNDKNLNKHKNEKLGLFQRFKIMYRDYWYVLVPVHLVTSAAWFGGFYYLAKSGVDIAGILESWNVSEKITNKLKDSHMGYLAISYALYKIATPLRYTVTLGGTTVSINYLLKWGYIKPVPSKDQLREMYREGKENIMETLKETKGFYQGKKVDFYESVKDTKIDLQKKKDKFKTQKDALVKDFENNLQKMKKVDMCWSLRLIYF